jgi:hypothetical protein
LIYAEVEDAQRLDVPAMAAQSRMIRGEAKKNVGAAMQVKGLPALEQRSRLTTHFHLS